MKNAHTTTTIAPGKLVILGEHAVVYGYPCIVSALDKGITVQISSASQDIFVTPGVSDHRFLTSSLTICRKRGVGLGPVQITVTSSLGTYGLGSSASVTVACCRALYEFSGVPYTESDLFSTSYAVILDVQSVGSGCDIAASIWKGTILFDGKTKQASSLSHELLPLVVGYSGKKVSTVSLVESLYDKRNTAMDGIYIKMGDLSKKGAADIQIKRWDSLGEKMCAQHNLLRSLGVSTAKLDALVDAAMYAGAWGAKLSGAGGGDCMIALVSEEKRKEVIQAITHAGGEVLDLIVGI